MLSGARNSRIVKPHADDRLLRRGTRRAGGGAAPKVIDDDQYPLSPRLALLKSALEKLDPGSRARRIPDRAGVAPGRAPSPSQSSILASPGNVALIMAVSRSSAVFRSAGSQRIVCRWFVSKCGFDAGNPASCPYSAVPLAAARWDCRALPAPCGEHWPWPRTSGASSARL
jgi:hypothetical protein